MPGVRWQKVLRDLRNYRARTLLVVASIAIGVSAVGTIVGSQALLDRSLADGFAASRSASATFYTATAFERELVDVVAGLPGVAEAEGRRSVIVRLELDGASRELQLTALPDFRRQSIDLVLAEQGTFPPRRGELLLERSALRLIEVEVGDEVAILLAGGDGRRLTVSGIGHAPGAPPAFYFGRLNAYVTFETLVDLGWDDSFDEMRIRVADESLDRAGVRTIADRVRQRIERAGAAITFALVPEPREHPAGEVLDAVFIVLAGIGFLSLFVAGFLVANTISVVLTQQTRQIGLMKAVGGGNGQIARLYLATVAAYAVMALAVAIPLAAVGAAALAGVATELLNLDLRSPLVPVEVIVLEVAIGLGVPIAAAIPPVSRAMRVTVRQALSDAGGPERFGSGVVDDLVRRIRGLPRPTLLSIRNTFRRKDRLALSLAALTLGGAVFMTVFTLRDSLLGTLSDTELYFNYDIQVDLARPVRANDVVAAALDVPGVRVAEPWQFASALRLRADESESASLVLFGLPPDAQTVRPVLQAGRWLRPGEGNALVVTANFLRAEPDLVLGELVRLRIAGRDSTWIIVGVVQSPTPVPFLYAGDDALGRVTRTVGRAGVVMIGTDRHDPAAQAADALRVRDRLAAAGIEVAATTTSGDISTTINTLFDTLIAFVSVMSLVLGVVGGLGLAGTMTMNVLERSREIGVLRAIGASDRAVLVMFLTEGLLIGVLAWFAGALISVPISRLLSDAIGDAFVQRPLAFVPSMPGFAAWFAAVVVLAALASLGPSWRAARVPVREVLAYE